MTEQKPEPAPAKRKTTRLRLTAPAWCTSFTLPRDGEDTLVVDQHGTEVPAKDAKSLIDTAARHGVTITEVSSK